MNEPLHEPTSAAGADSELSYLKDGGQPAVAELYSRYRDRLERMINFRLDRRLYGRVDPADVLQEAYIEVARRISDYLDAPQVSFFVWARQITWQTLLTVHRRHFGQKRDPGQEVPIHRQPTNATSFSIARQLVGQLTTPSQAAMREEQFGQLRQAIEQMNETDQEILALRHFEQLTNSEVAEILNLKETTASNRYVRALKRLREILEVMPIFQQ